MHTQWESLANEHILGIAPYEPGKPVEELERELGIHDAINSSRRNCSQGTKTPCVAKRSPWGS